MVAETLYVIMLKPIAHQPILKHLWLRGKYFFLIPRYLISLFPPPKYYVLSQKKTQQTNHNTSVLFLDISDILKQC